MKIVWPEYRERRKNMQEDISKKKKRILTYRLMKSNKRMMKIYNLTLMKRMKTKLMRSLFSPSKCKIWPVRERLSNKRPLTWTKITRCKMNMKRAEMKKKTILAIIACHIAMMSEK